jgi:signal peptide peptidase SppA
MTQRDATIALNRINLRSALISPSYAGFLADMRALAECDPTLEHDDFLRRRSEMASAFGYSFGYVTGYNFVRSQLASALADEDVNGIVFDVNTYGGEAAGCFELSDDIFNARGQKPMVAVIDSNCYSAGYALASAADKVIITPSGGAGSIGVVSMHVDVSAMLAEAGYKITFIYSGDHKVDGNPYEALPDDVRQNIQADVDASRDDFVALVARNRGMDSQKVRDTQAQSYRAEDALSLGLIDAIAAPTEAVNAFFNELSGSTPISLKRMNTMTPEEKAAAEQAQAAAVQAATAQAQKEASAAERTRMAGIIQSDEAKDKPKLASTLATTTELSVDDAKKVLAAAAPEVTSDATQTDKSANHFERAMNGGDNPNVGAADRAGKEADSEKGANRLLASHKAATGRDHKKAASK